MDVRGDLQALDLEDLAALLQKGACVLRGQPLHRAHAPDASQVTRREPAERLSVASREELLFLCDKARESLPELVGDVMRQKLLRRAERQKTHVSLKDLERSKAGPGVPTGNRRKPITSTT
jgi:hypothetical protein